MRHLVNSINFVKIGKDVRDVWQMTAAKIMKSTELITGRHRHHTFLTRYTKINNGL